MALLLWAGVKFYRSRVEGTPLAIRWEGAWLDYNFRDVGQSLNACLQQKLFREGLFLRANGWFSGWSCESVGAPEVIYSLNYDAARHERYFCETAAGSPQIGRHFNEQVKLHDLELLATWDDKVLVQEACGFFRDGIDSLSEGKRSLVHCDAGKDRTGAYVALVSALAAEAAGILDEPMENALECDYRKSRKLEAYKYGRVKTLIHTLRQTGGVGAFLRAQCGLAPGVEERLAAQLLLPPSERKGTP